MADNLVPFRASVCSPPSERSGDHVTRLGVQGRGLVLSQGPVVSLYAGLPVEGPTWMLPGNIAFWMLKEGRS